MYQFLVREANGAEKIYLGTNIQELEAVFNVKVIAVFCKLPE